MDRAVLETSSDRYVIVEYLAEGGMGAIYLGKKLGVGGFEKEVVLKQLLPEFTQEPKFIDLFLREARLSASLEHANIVHTIDLVNAGDDYFMVMEYVKGADLRTMLKRVRRKHKRFSPHAGVFIGHEILEALAYAHQKSAHDGRPLNLIHRDISPSNILLSGAGEVKLTDFGIAKASTHRSVFYKVKGKVGYMSPEQARGEPVDARSDLFSLGVVMYEVLVGERLFVGDIMSSASQIYAQPIKPPSNKRPEIPADLDAVVLKSLSLDPAGRFQSAEEFQEALSRVATRHRLLIGASEMSTHLKQIAGDDAAMWLKLEVSGHERGEPTQAHGTSVLSSAEDEDGVKPQFDLSDDDDDDEVDDNSDVDDLLRARNRPPSLPTGELTSVIAVRKKAGESDVLTRVKEGEVVPRWTPPTEEPTRQGSSAGQGRRSSSRSSTQAADEFGAEESRAQTKVREREPAPGNLDPPPARTPLSGETRMPPPASAQRASKPTQLRTSQPSQPRASQPNQTRASQPNQTRASQPNQARASQPNQTRASQPNQTRASQPNQARASQPNQTRGSSPHTPTPQPGPARGSQAAPPRGGTGTPAVGDATLVHPPSQAGFARPHANDASPQMPNPLGGSPLVAAGSGAGASAGRRLPTSGIRQRPEGGVFNGTAYIRRPRRLLGIMIVLLLIGIGVALGVAFSGPELEVVDPTLGPLQQQPAMGGVPSIAGPGSTSGGVTPPSSAGNPVSDTVPSPASPNAPGASPSAPGASPSAPGASPSAPGVPGGSPSIAPSIAPSAAPRQTRPPSELPGPPSASPSAP